jgi:hypothetical protein
MSRSIRKAIIRELERSPLPLSAAALRDRLEAKGYDLDEPSMRRAGDALIATGRIAEAGAHDSAGRMCWRLTREPQRLLMVGPGGGEGLDDASSALLHALDTDVLRELEADVRFFRKHPERSHRIRHAFPAEARQAAILMRGEALAEGLAFFLATERLPSGTLLRLYLTAPINAPVDVPESWVTALFAEAVAKEGFSGDHEAFAAAACLDAHATGSCA